MFIDKEPNRADLVLAQPLGWQALKNWVLPYLRPIGQEKKAFYVGIGQPGQNLSLEGRIEMPNPGALFDVHLDSALRP